MYGMPQQGAGGAGVKPGPIELPKAVYDDLMLLRDDWSNLVRSLGGVGATLLKDVVAEPGEGDSMILAFEDSHVRDMAVNTGAVKNLETKAQEKYGKHFAFRTRIKETGEEAKTYVTREELENLINMPIDIETEE